MCLCDFLFPFVSLTLKSGKTDTRRLVRETWNGRDGWEKRTEYENARKWKQWHRWKDRLCVCVYVCVVSVDSEIRMRWEAVIGLLIRNPIQSSLLSVWLRRRVSLCVIVYLTLWQWDAHLIIVLCLNTEAAADFFFPVLILHNQIMQRYEVSHTSHLLIQSCRGSRSETTQILCQKNRDTERLWRQKWLKCLSEGAEWCPDWGTGDPNAGCSEWGIVGVGSWQEAVGVCWEGPVTHLHGWKKSLSLAVKAISSPAFWCRKSHFLYDRYQP